MRDGVEQDDEGEDARDEQVPPLPLGWSGQYTGLVPEDCCDNADANADDDANDNAAADANADDDAGADADVQSFIHFQIDEN